LPSFIVAGLGKLEDQKEIGQRIGPGEEGNQAGLGWAFSRKQKATEAAASNGGNHGRWALGTAGDAVAAAALQSAAPQQCQTDKQIDWPWADEEKAKKAEKTRRQKKLKRKQERGEAREKRGKRVGKSAAAATAMAMEAENALPTANQQQRQRSSSSKLFGHRQRRRMLRGRELLFLCPYRDIWPREEEEFGGGGHKAGDHIPTNQLLSSLGFSPPEFCCCQTTNTGEYRRRIFH
jgi:hypothetical protein